MGKLERISREQFLEARLGYVAMLLDRGECTALIQGATDLKYPEQVEKLEQEVRDRDNAAAEEEMVEEHAICLYQVYRKNCLKHITAWRDCKEHVRDRWREIARSSLRHGKALAVRILQAQEC